jgi:hypothetical protein
MLYFTSNQRHGEIFRIFDRTDLKIIRVKLFFFFFFHNPKCFCKILNSKNEVLCGIKIEKLHTYVGLEVESMQKKGLGIKKPRTFSKEIKTK